MDLEQLKLVISAVSGVAGDAKQAVIWYYALAFGESLLLKITWIILVVFVVNKAVRMILKLNNASDDTKRDLQFALMYFAHSYDMPYADRERIELTIEQYSKREQK